MRLHISQAIRTVILLSLSSAAIAVDDPYQKHLDRYLKEPSASSDPEGMFNRDYYSRDPEVRNLLRTVEAYHMEQGIGKFKAGRLQPAYDEFDFILRYYPNHPRALALMGDLCVVMQRQKDCEKYFDKAVTLFPDMTRSAKGVTLREYGKLLYRFGDNERALKILQQSVALDGFSSETHYYLGLAHFAAKDYVRANTHAQKAYAKKFPLTELREKLMAADAWKPGIPAKPVSRGR